MAITSNTYRHLDVHLCDVFGNSCINVEKSKLKLEVAVEGSSDSADGNGDGDETHQNCDFFIEARTSPGESMHVTLKSLSLQMLYFERDSCFGVASGPHFHFASFSGVRKG